MFTDDVSGKPSYVLSDNCSPTSASLLTSSLTGIAHKMRIGYLVFKRPECIPITIQALKKYAETIEEFIVRRIRFVADCFIKEGICASYSKLTMRAGLAEPHLLQLPKVQREIKESLIRINNSVNPC